LKRGWLAPLTPLYAAGLSAKNVAYDSGWLRARRLRWPVVSVGNLSVGGSGKTPLTIRLAELLVADGFRVDVLSRGYGRSSSAVEEVNPAGDASRFGDEPLLIARRVGVPVFVGSSRYEAGLLAEGVGSRGPDLLSSPKPMSQNRDPSTGSGQAMGHPHSLSSGDSGQPNWLSPPKPTSQKRDVGHPHGLSPEDSGLVHLLDDGFQHRRLFRDVDVVVLHRSDFGERLLPAGRLREPLTALRRADFVVIREEDSGLEAVVRALGVEAPIWRMKRSINVQPELATSTERVVAFCGIARPQEFFSSLIAIGVNLELAVAFADHHRYASEDVERLAQKASAWHAEAFVTTEKDSVKLDAQLLGILEANAPVRVARLAVSLRDEASVVRQLREKLAAT